MSLNALSICFAKEDSDVSKLKHGMSFSPKKCSSQSPAVLPINKSKVLTSFKLKKRNQRSVATGRLVHSQL
ncbi:hypothetical protein P8452_14700 [Trifolium repens]|nr:hypothetical protein P8452_14700 [Trifolium repens]